MCLGAGTGVVWHAKCLTESLLSELLENHLRNKDRLWATPLSRYMCHTNEAQAMDTPPQAPEPSEFPVTRACSPPGHREVTGHGYQHEPCLQPPEGFLVPRDPTPPRQWPLTLGWSVTSVTFSPLLHSPAGSHKNLHQELHRKLQLARERAAGGEAGSGSVPCSTRLAGEHGRQRSLREAQVCGYLRARGPGPGAHLG